ncbi:PREDICTED: cell wall protein RBR3 [Drosophila arizonae]|uniref:Cell wall protein RBR3 n=1 Tax=Drosophila arizonae TaxID=7263 RepID=A0ABM1PEH2_DROAR|nr:PREDICTED: cell wall protein RBR3 [Drosophila arizonae]
MPCESCGIEFTVFRRKRSCFDCRRYYCSNCLTGATAATTLTSTSRRCQRCAIFAQRPLLRTDLLKLKPKDLIFYLQSKHISTEGCLEKEELVGLVLTHVAQSDRERGCPPNQNQSPGRGQANPMDSLKQTCQNFFTNLSDNISDSLASFDTKSSSKSTSNSRQASNDNGATTPPTHIFEQPRVSTREIPTYASAGGVQPTPVRTPSIPRTNSTEVAHVHVSPSTSSTHTTTSPTATQERRTLATEAARLLQQAEPDNSECDCSDDEIITTFSERTSLKNSENSAGPASRPTLEISSAAQTPTTTAIATATTATATTTATTSTSPGYSKQGSLSSKVDACGADASSQSSFEELGAIGGISDESKATTDTNSSNLDQWQILEQTSSSQPPQQQLLQDQQQQQQEVDAVNDDEILQVTLHTEPQPPQRVKKVTRRRSEGYLNRRHQSSDDDDESPVAPLHGLALSTLSEQPEPALGAVASNSCQRCGKNKTNIRRHVDKMRRHLENSQMSEADIKRELQEFLSYLEQRTKSLECSDADSHAVSPLSSVEAGATGVAHPMPITPTIEFSPTQDDHETHWEDDEGIHVYASPLGFEPPNSLDSRFVNLEEFEDRKDLENLTVKQLKEVLMLHRVDYKGCCEKQELLDRVCRLWKTLRTAPAVEKLATDELCKICMDAPIECVFLECGHMATCTNCGKVLNECPICRQYIVRVVRFFRA